MTTAPPPLPDFLQAFVISADRPPVLLSVYDKGEYAADVEDYTRETARLLHWSLLGFCHLDFVVLPCCMTFDDLQSLADLEREVDKKMRVVERYFKSPLLLSEFTFSKLKDAATALVRSTFVPSLLEPEENSKMWILLMDKTRADKMSGLIEDLHKGNGQFKLPCFSFDEGKDDVIIALEVAKRISFSGTVEVTCTSDTVTSCLKRLMLHIMEDLNISLHLTCNDNSCEQGMLQLQMAATELQQKIQRTFDLILDGQILQLCQYQFFKEQEFLDKFTEFCTRNKEEHGNVFHVGDIEFGLPLLYWLALDAHKETVQWCLTIMEERLAEPGDLPESLLSAAIAAILFSTDSGLISQAKCFLGKLFDQHNLTLEYLQGLKLTLPLPEQAVSKDKIDELKTRFLSGDLCYLGDPSLSIPASLLSVSVTEDAVSVELCSQHWYLALRLLADREVDQTDRDGNTLLHIAAHKGNLEAITLAVKSGASLTQKNNKCLTPYQLAQQRRDKYRKKPHTSAEFCSAICKGNEEAVHMSAEFHSAICEGNEEAVKIQLCCHSSVEDKDLGGRTGLYLACQHGQGNIANLLISLGADVKAKDNRNGRLKPNTSLQHACKNGLTQTVELLIKHHADINTRNYTGQTALHFACQCESPTARADITRLLLDAGADINARDGDGYTPLHWASCNGHTDCVKVLIDTGAGVNTRDGDGYTPLHLALRDGHKDCFKELIDRGADLNAWDRDGKTPLHWASLNGHTDCVKELIDHGAGVNTRDRDGKTPLHCALRDGHTDCVKVLIDHGADVNTRYGDGETPLHCALRKGHTDCVKVLIDNGADLNAGDRKSNTPLHCAVQSGHTETLTLLISHGADLNAKDEDGRTPLHLTYLTKRPDMMTQLVEAGAETGRVHQAVVRGDVDALTTLLQKGADVNQHDTSMGCRPMHAACLMRHTDIITCLLHHAQNTSTQ